MKFLRQGYDELRVSGDGIKGGEILSCGCMYNRWEEVVGGQAIERNIWTSERGELFRPYSQLQAREFLHVL